MSSEMIIRDDDGGQQSNEIVEDIRGDVEQDEYMVETAMNSVDPKKTVHLKKTFGLLTCIALTVGSVVGSGIFGAANYGAVQVHSLSTAVMLFAIFGLISTVGAVCYVEIGTAFPLSGGDYSYCHVFFGPLGGCLYQWAANFMLTPCDLAILSTVVALYAIEAMNILGDKEEPDKQGALFINAGICISVAVLCLITVIGVLSTKAGEYVAKVLLGVKFITATLIISVAIYHAASGHAFAGAENLKKVYIQPKEFNVTIHGNVTAPVLDQFFSLSRAMYETAFSYSGWTSISFVVEEVKNPYRTLPLTALISLPLITALYIVINFCYFSVVPHDKYISTNRAASEMFKTAFPDAPGAYWIVPTLVALCALGVLVCIVIVYARITLVGARHGHFPRFFSLLHVNRYTPIPSLLFSVCVTVCYISLGIEYLVPIIGAATYLRLLTNGIVVAGNVYWRFKRPEYPRPFKTFIWLHIVFVITIVFLALIPFITADWTFKKNFEDGWKNQILIVGGPLLILIIGIPVYFLTIKMKWTGNGCQRGLLRAENSIGIFFQKFFLCAPEGKGEEAELEKYKLR